MKNTSISVIGMVLVLVVAGVCRKETATVPAQARPDLAPSPPAAMPRGDEDVKSVYPAVAEGAVPELAQKLCDALHFVVEERRAACCSTRTISMLRDECVRTLGAAVRSGAVRLDDKEVAACRAAIEKSLEGCGWVGPFPPDLPAACDGIVHGTLAAGATCRSTLECAGTLRCSGVSPTSKGVCGAPQPVGNACGLGGDVLAAYTRQESQIQRARPECDGSCERHRCNKLRNIGDACDAQGQCGPGRHCGDGRCRDGAFARTGEPCTAGGCESGARCVGGRCIVPAEEGAPCKTDFDCRGACDKARGLCAKDCARR